MKQCVICNKAFEESGRQYKTCSHECRVKNDANRTKANWHKAHPEMKFNCDMCGKAFTSTRKNAKTCSKECNRKRGYQQCRAKYNANKKTYDKKCVVCGKAFQTHWSYRKTCSDKCSVINDKENRRVRHIKEYKPKKHKTERPCVICGNPFESQYDQHKVCSKRCRKKLHHANAVNRKYKKILYKQQEGCCNFCKRRLDIVDLEVDHKLPQTRGGNSELENLQLLCRFCNVAKRDEIETPELIAEIVRRLFEEINLTK